MKQIHIVLILLFLFSCGKTKVVQLPEIDHSDISEIQDVSAAYLFYDELNPEGFELNRKNLISSTNWLVNIDKRLSLKQVIPQIIFLQNKKQGSEHKNQNAKNYFTCHDLSRKNLGFIEFTDVIYEEKIIKHILTDPISNNPETIIIYIASLHDIQIHALFESQDIINTTISKLHETLVSITKNENKTTILRLCFNEHLLFQEYITFRSILTQKDLKNISLSKTEYISN